ncbi:MAG: methionyl-tRNA formyltransferase [Gammaproteobacteria bacterium]
MKIFLFLGSRRGHAVLIKLIEARAHIAGILCLVEDPHEEQYHPKVTAIAKEHNIPIYYSSDVKSSEYKNVLQQLKPDIAFAIGWRYLITKEAYSIPTKGTLIIHDSLLPRYRGFAPMNWAIINGEKESGVTLFYIAEGVDCGPIVDQLSTPINEDDTAKTVDERIIKLYEEIITKNLSALAAGTAKSTPQDDALASYTCKRTPEDGEINWQKSALQIHDLIRGLTHPFPGAYTTLRGKRILIWGSQVSATQDKYIGNIPGRVVGKKNGMIEVLTGDGMIRLSRLQFMDEDEKDAKDIPISVKDTFGR